MITCKVVETHRHLCPVCKDEYPGYSPKCEEPKELICGACLAASFRYETSHIKEAGK